MFFDCERCKGGYKVIFVTVGTHEQPFNRLIEYIDDLKQMQVRSDSINTDPIGEVNYLHIKK